MNLAPMAKSLAFHIQDKTVVWEEGQFDLRADDVLSQDKDETRVDEAVLIPARGSGRRPREGD